MNRNIPPDEWAAFFKEFSAGNYQRPTRLEILDEQGFQTEEHSLPLSGIDLEWNGANTPRVEILLGNGTEGPRLSHTVGSVQQVLVKVGPDGRDEVLDLESEQNIKTLLHLEQLPELAS